MLAIARAALFAACVAWLAGPAAAQPVPAPSVPAQPMPAQPVPDRSTPRFVALLTALYEKVPASRTCFSEALIAEAAKGLPKKDRSDLLEQFKAGTREFPAARSQALAKAKATPKRHAVVSGLAVVGLMATAHLAHAGYKVDAYELRAVYDRNIQWAGRQSLLDELATVDPTLPADYLREVSAPLPKGSLHLSPKGRQQWPVDPISNADPMRVPADGEAMMALPSLFNMEARVFVALLRRYIATLPNVTVHKPATIKLTGPDKDGRYGIEGGGTPDLIVIAEGARSDTRTALGINSLPASPAREQLAGALVRESGGIMSKHYHSDANSGETLLTGTMGRKGAGKTWVVADIPPGTSYEPPRKLKKGTHAYRAAAQVRIDAHFRELAAPALEITPAQANAARLLGPFDPQGPADPEGPKPFMLQQFISEKVTAGTNIVLIGDAARAGHWSVGGGMQTGSVADIECLKRVLVDIDLGSPREASFELFAKGIAGNSLAWLRRGIIDFYPDVERQSAMRAFAYAEKEWRAGHAASPLEALTKLLPAGSRAKAVQPIPGDVPVPASPAAPGADARTR